MATATITCPQCDANLRFSNAPAPGKKIRCPKCSSVILMPDDDDPDADRRVQEKPRMSSKPMRKDLEERRRPKKKRKQESSNTPIVLGAVCVGILLVIGIGAIELLALSI